MLPVLEPAGPVALCPKRSDHDCLMNKSELHWWRWCLRTRVELAWMTESHIMISELPCLSQMCEAAVAHKDQNSQ